MLKESPFLNTGNSMLLLLALIGISGNLALAAVVYGPSKPITELDRLRLKCTRNLSDSDIVELMAKAGESMIAEVQRYPTYGRPPADTVWKFRLLGIGVWPLEYQTDKVAKAKRFLSRKSLPRQWTAVVDAELIPSSDAGPEMRYMYFDRDENGRWQPREYKPGEMGKWESYYF